MVVVVMAMGEGGDPGAPAQSVRPQTGRSRVQSPAGS